MVNHPIITATAIWAALQEVKDPEIPVISVIDLGLVRDVRIEEHRVVVCLTPTFLGCPAIDVIRAEIARRVRALGAREVEVELALYPPWTSDWITERGRDQLKTFGLALPVRHGGLIQIIFADEAVCPYCGSKHTEQKNAFGATLCRALYFCHDCQEPFERFKAL
jgi:ring-1,2-phenylacetyl-CoA epoxidase subunit PaaD